MSNQKHNTMPVPGKNYRNAFKHLRRTPRVEVYTNRIIELCAELNEEVRNNASHVAAEICEAIVTFADILEMRNSDKVPLDGLTDITPDDIRTKAQHMLEQNKFWEIEGLF